MADVWIRDLPDDVHRRLSAQAAAAGQSLNEFLFECMRNIAHTPSVPELADRIRRGGGYEGPSSADAVRRDRDRR